MTCLTSQMTRQFNLPLSEGRAARSREITVAVSHTLLVLALAALLVVSVSAIATCRLLIKAYFNTYYVLLFGVMLKAFASLLCSNYFWHNFRKPTFHSVSQKSQALSSKARCRREPGNLLEKLLISSMSHHSCDKRRTLPFR